MREMCSPTIEGATFGITHQAERDEYKLTVDVGGRAQASLSPYTQGCFKPDPERHVSDERVWLRAEFREDANGNRGCRPLNASLVIFAKEYHDATGDTTLPPTAALIVGPTRIWLPVPFAEALYAEVRQPVLTLVADKTP